MADRNHSAFSVSLPSGIRSKLLKIAAFLGIPATSLGEFAITLFVLKYWNPVEHRPVRKEGK